MTPRGPHPGKRCGVGPEATGEHAALLTAQRFSLSGPITNPEQRALLSVAEGGDPSTSLCIADTFNLPGQA